MPLICFLFFFQALFGLDKSTQEEIRLLVERNPSQLSESEYTFIAEHLEQKAPCNMLVFGVGRDSDLWMKLNPLGATVFLEDNKEWLEIVKSQVPEIEVYPVKYNTKRGDWKLWLNTGNLMLNLPEKLMQTKWDIIFVDGPEGWADEKPGRMKSIYTAAHLARASGDCRVFVHDSKRPVEAAFGSKYLEKENLEFLIDKLSVYYIP